MGPSSDDEDDRSSAGGDSSSTTSSKSSSGGEASRRRRKREKKDRKHRKKEKKGKKAKKAKKQAKKRRKKQAKENNHKRRKEEEPGRLHVHVAEDADEQDPTVGPSAPAELQETGPPPPPPGDDGGGATLDMAVRRSVVFPMPQSEAEAAAAVTRRVFEPDTGRTRLVKASGEIVEEIVSKQRQHAIRHRASMTPSAAAAAHTVQQYTGREKFPSQHPWFGMK